MVTGAGKGIGEAVAASSPAWARSSSAAPARRPTSIAWSPEITAAGGTAVGFAGDVRRFDDMERLAKTVVDTYGKIDFAVPNAGIDIEGNMCDADPADWQRMIETNVLGTAYMIRAMLPYMRAAERRSHRHHGLDLGARHLRRRAHVHRQQVGHRRHGRRAAQGGAEPTACGSPRSSPAWSTRP